MEEDMSRRTTEEMLSDMAAERERDEAEARHLDVAGLRALRRACDHDWEDGAEAGGLIDVCRKCGEGRA
jgi:hypothetical protein